MPATNPPAPLEIKYAQASNLGTLVGIEIRSFPSSNYMRSTYKGCDPRAVHTFKTVSALQYFAKPECHLLAGVLGGGDIIAYGRWHIPAIHGLERAVDTNLSSDAQAQMRDMWAYAPELNRGTYSLYEEMIRRSRGRHLRKTDFVLELLCVLPEYQRMGVGSAFLEWGIERADASNARIYLEATMEGVPAYLKHGWRVVEEILLDYTERGGEGSQRFALMIREPRGVGLRE
ncbi:GNAT family acetyltransferase [Aspergillus uvarum CBS 121591]|uniref:GNAT family acetyltransferase n=1 Tax=Aspergillus uvarum CBS 121591 TaxID=1448315 RepID=A0A319E2Y4_9EURO|nr:GNAT family acetyltransferase [Aspergillus uvarum CBS 121591]PYH85492.1 GNAT family acetyltransferase [Aspergillus uvarum CBS 121591]